MNYDNNNSNGGNGEDTQAVSTSRFSVSIKEEDGGNMRHEILSFNDQNPGFDYTVDSMPDDTFKTSDMNDDLLGNFFSRPIKIQSYSWSTSTTFFESFNPWQDFFENPRVINRLSNFNLLRAKLKVKILINGNGFYFGRGIASYNPLPTYDQLTVDRAFFRQDLIAASQRPKVFLDPTKSLGGTLTLPFFWYKNYLSIPNQEWRDMGEMIIQSFDQLKHANGSTVPVVVNVFAWAEDVTLAIPTSTEPGALEAQAGEVNDEYAQGPISKPANVIAKVAGRLAAIPQIAPFAIATDIAASAVANIATMFGYCRPISISEIVPYKPVIMGNLANTNAVDSANKLTVDIKQELTIDPRTMGLGNADEMVINSIACRESYLTQFPWATADASEAHLWSARVTPAHFDTLTPASTTEYHLTACAMAAAPFKYWRGSMKFRFQIVASEYHKGRLKIVYDPQYVASNEYNIVYTHVIDLAKERDFEVCLGWGQERPFAEVGAIVPGSPVFQLTPYVTTDSNTNGTLAVYVVNPLTPPGSSTDDVDINVFVSACDDFEVAEPDDRTLSNMSYYEPQSGEVFEVQSGEMDQADKDLTVRESEPMKMTETESFAGKLDPTDNTFKVFFGDPIVSFRTLLKRYNYSLFHAWTDGTDGTYRVLTSTYPIPPGYDPNGIHLTDVPVADTPYNYTNMTLMNFLTPCYAARRGGIRWKYLAHGLSNTLGDIEAALVPTFDGAYNTNIFPFQNSGSTSVSERASNIIDSHTHGLPATFINSVTRNNAAEVEVPQYTPTRFVPGKWNDFTGGNWGEDDFAMVHRIGVSANVNPAMSPGIHSYVAAAEDFTLSFFLGAPRIFERISPTPT